MGSISINKLIPIFLEDNRDQTLKVVRLATMIWMDSQVKECLMETETAKMIPMKM